MGEYQWFKATEEREVSGSFQEWEGWGRIFIVGEKYNVWNLRVK